MIDYLLLERKDIKVFRNNFFIVVEKILNNDSLIATIYKLPTISPLNNS